jgi:hypothetical protein
MVRAFKAIFLCAIEDDDLEEDRDTPVTLAEVKDYLGDALRLTWNDEECGNPVGLSSVEVVIEGLTELSEDERKRLYGK